MPSLLKGLCLLASVLTIFTGEVNADALGDLQTKGRPAINTQLAKSKTCTAANLVVRKEWYVIVVAGSGFANLAQGRRLYGGSEGIHQSCVVFD